MIHNTYVDKTVVYHNTYNHTSYNGGKGGIHAQPTSGEIAAQQHQHPPTSEQQYHEQTASQDRNHTTRPLPMQTGKPPSRTS